MKHSTLIFRKLHFSFCLITSSLHITELNPSYHGRVVAVFNTLWGCSRAGAIMVQIYIQTARTLDGYARGEEWQSQHAFLCSLLSVSFTPLRAQYRLKYFVSAHRRPGLLLNESRSSSVKKGSFLFVTVFVSSSNSQIIPMLKRCTESQ
jgi:hypothetical protein